MLGIISHSSGIEPQVPYIEFESFQQVDKIEPKRCYVVSQVIRSMDRGNTRYLQDLTPEEFQRRLRKAKEEVLALSEADLDKRILLEKYPKRLKGYNAVCWYKGIVHANEVGVWKGAGGLPVEWTEGSLADTARRVSKALINSENTKVAARAKRVIPRMQALVKTIEKEKYLYPIILPPATNGRGQWGRPYKNFDLMKGDIDDGCMRAISLAVSGRISFYAFIGIK